MDMLRVRCHGLLTMRRFIAIAFLLSTSQAWASFGYYSPISINSAQVPSTQTDFPVLVSVTDNRFKTVGNGGHVQNSSGFDIRPYTNSGLGTAITGYELERYNASTGEVIMWVKVSSLSSSTTPFVLAYGDSGISTDGSSTTTWSNSFLNVFHVKDGTTLSVVDSVTATGTNHGATATSGQVDGCASFASGSSQWIDGNSSFAFSPAVTISAWVNATSFPNSFNAVAIRDQSIGNIYTRLSVNASGKLVGEIMASADVSFSGTGSHTLSTATWYYLTLTYSSSAGLVAYVNAASDKTVAANGAISTSFNANTWLGDNQRFGGTFWNGKIDEGRFASVARSADWITTEYNNQSAPGTFETLGTEQVPVATNNGWFYFFP